MRKQALTIKEVQSLRHYCLQFGKDAAAQKLSALQKITGLALSSAAALKAYHEVLLFIQAYPDNAAVYKLAYAELQRIAATVDKIMKGNNQRQQLSLSGTGIANTTTIAGFSYTITNWMLQQFGDAVSLESAAGDKDSGAAILHYLFPHIEYYYTTQGNMGLQQRVHALLGKDDTLKRMTGLFQSSRLTGKLADILYDQLQVFTTWRHADPVFNRSFIRATPHRVFYHTGLKKHFDPSSLIHQTGSAEITLTASQKEYIVAVARASLAFYHRETDPVTYADEKQLRLFDAGCGVTIALFTKKLERRLALESYIGYMVFKNGIPLSYGGGWIFGHRCKIGVNIYPPFRGGESLWLFTQVLRLFRQQFAVHRFIVRPYQFGKGNAEGLKSGAFWFYYKLGFRPVQEEVAAVAAAAAVNKHHTPVETLKLFTTCDMEWQLVPQPVKDKDIAAGISRAVTQLVNEQYQGDRDKAIRITLAQTMKALSVPTTKTWTPTGLHHLQQFSLILPLLPHFPVWTATEKKQLLQLILAKAHPDEAKYTRLLQQHQRFLAEMGTLVNI